MGAAEYPAYVARNKHLAVHKDAVGLEAPLQTAGRSQEHYCKSMGSESRKYPSATFVSRRGDDLYGKSKSAHHFVCEARSRV